MSDYRTGFARINGTLIERHGYATEMAEQGHNQQVRDEYKLVADTLEGVFIVLDRNVPEWRETETK